MKVVDLIELNIWSAFIRFGPGRSVEQVFGCLQLFGYPEKCCACVVVMGLDQVRQRYHLQQEGKLSEEEEQVMRDEAAERIRKLPPIARKLFEKRREELVKTGELEQLQNDTPKTGGGESLSVATKIDLIVFAVGLLILGGALYTEYKINVFAAFYKYIVSLLDPGMDPARDL